MPGPEGIDASLAFVIACWPVLDPLARYKMAKAKGMDDMSRRIMPIGRTRRRRPRAIRR